MKGASSGLTEPELEELDLPGVFRAKFPLVHYNGSFLVEPYRQGWGGLFDRPLAHLYWIVTSRGVVRDWGCHEQTTDRYAAVFGTVEVALVDGRVGSATEGALRIETLDSTRGEGLLIPPGIWHTFRATSETAVLLNSKTPPFDPDRIDKRLLPMPNEKIAFVWGD